MATSLAFSRPNPALQLAKEKAKSEFVLAKDTVAFSQHNIASVSISRRATADTAIAVKKKK